MAERDVGTIYRLLNDAGVPQRDIASLVGQSQSEVCEILKGRTVMTYDVLARIAEGLDIPRGCMGLAYPEDLLPQEELGEEVDEEMKRRALIALAGVTLFDRPVLGEVLELPRRPAVPTPLPSQLGRSDVAALDALTAELRSWAQLWGGGAGTISTIAYRSERLLTVQATSQVHTALKSTLAKLHTVAGWAAFDERLDNRARDHFGEAITLAGSAGDPYWIAFALYGGGRIVSEQGHPDDALKHFQLSHLALKDDKGRHSRAPVLQGYLHSESALELAVMGHPTARGELSKAQESPFDADSYNIAAETYMSLGNLTKAHEMGVQAVQRWKGHPNRRHAVVSDIVLATINVKAGEHRGKVLARTAIQSVAGMRSGLARVRLERLATELEARPTAENRDLAAMARRVTGSKPKDV